jgi:hypothetical protein
MKEKKPRRPPNPPKQQELQPWDPRPDPKEGDPHEDITFAAVGRALTGWERFETKLSEMFGAIVSPDADTLAAQRAYGSGTAFHGRAKMVAAAGAAYFNVFPDEKLASAVRDLLALGTNYAARRNDIAHGTVKYYGGTSPTSKVGFALFPSAYNTSRNELLDPLWATILFPHQIEPKYTYSSLEIFYFTAKFVELADRADYLAGQFLERYTSREKAARHANEPTPE